MADTTLVLGSVTFADLEIPPSIPFGGEQHLSVHELIGGARVIDAMGRADRPIEWTGWFRGTTAVERAQLLDSLRVSGVTQSLTWGKFSYSVVVKSFLADYQRFYEIPYRILCEVISDLTTPVVSAAPPIDQVINSDASDATALATAIADQSLNASISAMNTAIGTIATIATAARSIINGVLAPAGSAKQRVAVLIGLSNLQIASSTFAGVAPGIAAGVSAAALTAQTANMLYLPNLFTLQGLLGRMVANLNSLNTSPNTIAVAGGNLYRVATQQYGDATAWTAIAKANNLTDPFVQGSQILTIPTQSDQSGGILSN